MKTNKNIDRLFQEKFKDLEIVPPKNVWSNIEAILDEKHKTKKIIPLWLRLSGVAAVLLLLTFGAINYFDSSKNEIIITDIDSKDLPPKIKNTLKQDLLIDNKENSIITDASQNEDKLIESLKINDTQKNQSKGIKKQNSKTVIANKINKSKNKFKTNNKTEIPQNKYDEKIQNNNSSVIANNISDDSNSNNSKFKTNSKILEGNSKNNENSIIKNVSSTRSNVTVSNTQNSIKESVKSDSNINDLTKDKENITVSENNNTNLKQALKEIENKDKTEKVVTQNIEKLEDLLPNADSDKDKKKEETIKKWSVASNVAPIFYNSFSSKGSPLDLDFISSPKNGSKSISYGFKIGYQLNEKLTIQTGVSEMKVGYQIRDVYINSDQQLEGRLTNVSYNSNIVILSVKASNFLDNNQIETISSTPVKGELNQNFGYIEVPLELKYRLTNTKNKFGVNLVGGFSTMFLNKNDVYVSTSDFSSNLGKANNLNDVNFSGNLGLDLDYKINKKVFINIAPTIKIHTRTFSNSDKNFKPYLFGVYTGLNYRF